MPKKFYEIDPWSQTRSFYKCGNAQGRQGKYSDAATAENFHKNIFSENARDSGHVCTPILALAT